jgi:hypothetical protein
VVALAAIVATACSDSSTPGPAGSGSSSGSSGGGCPSAQPSSCPQTPSYKNDIAPLVAQECLPCHASGGQSADIDFTTYAGLTRYETTILSQVNGCLMPPAGSNPLSLAQRTELLQWVVCGAPNN